MSEVLVVARVAASLEKRETVAGAIDALAHDSRREDGCVTYDVFVSPNDPSDFLIFEVWSSDAALKLHGQTAHIASFKAVVQGCATIEVQKLKRV